MRKIVDYISWGFILVFAIPTVLIMASWNSLPGEPMYGVKRAFEEVLLLVARPSYAAEANLHVQYTERRMGEVKVLIAKDNSSEGLTQLSQQIRATKTVIERAPNKVVQKQIAQKYISTLRNVSNELTTSQSGGQQVPHPTGQVRRIYPTYTPYPTSGGNHPQPTIRPTATPIITGETNTILPTPTPAPEQGTDTVDNVDEVQQQIDDTIQDLETLSAADTVTVEPTDTPEPTAVPTPVPTVEVHEQVGQQTESFNGITGSSSGNNGNGNGDGNGGNDHGNN